MKILYLPLNWDEYPLGTLHALQRQFGPENVRDFDYLSLGKQFDTPTVNAMLQEECRRWRPDVVHGQYQETNTIWPDTLSEIKRKYGPFLTCWMGDCRTSVPAYTAKMCSRCDLNLLSNVGQLDTYRKASGRPFAYWQIGVDWHRDFDLSGRRPPQVMAFDVIFSGRHYPQTDFPGVRERLDVVRAFTRSGISFAVVGSNFPGDVRSVGEQPRADQRWWYAAAKLSVGVNNFNQIERFYSERQLQAMASGTCHLCWRIPGLEEEFRDGVDCVMFDSPAEAVEKAHALLADDDRRKRIGEQGRATVLARHTWDARMVEFRTLIRQHGGPT